MFWERGGRGRRGNDLSEMKSSVSDGDSTIFLSIGKLFLRNRFLKERGWRGYMYTHVIIRYGELFLKGKNRKVFERKLRENMRKQFPDKKIFVPHGRLVMNYFDQHLLLRKIFGLVSYSPAVKVEKDFLKIQQAVIRVVNHKAGTFRIDASRADKRFLFTSPEINRTIGEYIEQHTLLQFSLKNAHTIISIEINHDAAYIFTETISCVGGLPVGVEGSVFTLIENKASLLAAIVLMKRGCDIIPIGFARQDISLLQKYSPQVLELGHIGGFDELEKIARGRIVASGQTFDTYTKYDTLLVVVRPLIAYDKNRVIEELEYFEKI